MRVQVFLSCSFRREDAAAIALIRSVATALGFECVNVDTASPKVPPDEARRLIGESAGVIAVATRCAADGLGAWYMPPSVHDEISIAYGMRAPLLLFRESGVRIEGLAPNYSTYLEFDRDRLDDTEIIGKFVAAISAFRKEVATVREHLPASSPGLYYESIRRLCSLEETPAGFVRHVVNTRRVRFEASFQGTLHAKWWCSDAERTAPTGAPPM